MIQLRMFRKEYLNYFSGNSKIRGRNQERDLNPRSPDKYPVALLSLPTEISRLLGGLFFFEKSFSTQTKNNNNKTWFLNVFSYFFSSKFVLNLDKRTKNVDHPQVLIMFQWLSQQELWRMNRLSRQTFRGFKKGQTVREAVICQEGWG